MPFQLTILTRNYEYPDKVRLELEQEEVASYERAADFLNFNGNDLVCLQHEYGIYGGTAGRHILAMLRRLKMHIGKRRRVSLSQRYLSFLWLAFRADTGRFRNFLSYERKWVEDVGSDDSHGRALWALGKVLANSRNAGLRGAAGRLFETAVPATLTFTSPRAWAFSILGMQAYLDWFPGDRSIQGARNVLANRLLDIYQRTNSPNWRWFEKSLSYSNARLSQALLLAGWRSDNQRMIEAGMDSLKWLVAEQHRDDPEVFVSIGSNGFYVEGCEKARFDQQPVEACATISACLEVFRLTEDQCWLEEAQRVFSWFMGRNDLQVPIYDPTTGGCRHGLHPDRINENQGAESTLSFLMALLEMRAATAVNADELEKEASVTF